MKTVLLRKPAPQGSDDVASPAGAASRPRSLPLILKPPQEPPHYRAYSEAQLDQIPQIADASEERRFAMRVVSRILPFRVNEYVLDELIDWQNVPNDPVFQLTFPQRGMLSDEHFGRMAALLTKDPSKAEIKALANEIRAELNPHPAGQKQLNVPHLDGKPLPGLQHKYDETVLFFPAQGQTCHAYCSFCFRWAQFVGQQGVEAWPPPRRSALHGYLESPQGGQRPAGHRRRPDGDEAPPRTCCGATSSRCCSDRGSSTSRASASAARR